MRCREAQHRLNENAVIDGDLRDHLENCESCFRQSAAMHKLNSLFLEERSRETEGATPFNKIREIVNNLTIQKKKEKSLMARVRNEISGHPRLSLSLLTATCIFAVILMLPFSYTQTVGYSVAYMGLDPAYEPADGLLTEALASLGYDQVSVDIVRNGPTIDYEISNLATANDARKAAAAFAALSGFSGNPEIIPITRQISASLYAQAWDRLSKIEINSEGKTDAELKTEIEDKLRNQGFSNMNVSVTTKPDGMREISVKTINTQDTCTTEKQLEIVVSDGDISFDASHEISVDSKNKTNAEIADEVRNKLAEQGIANPQITVTTDSAGRHRIEVNVEEDE